MGLGPVKSLLELERALREGIFAVERGGQVLIDVRIAAGYSPAMAAGITREG